MGVGTFVGGLSSNRSKGDDTHDWAILWRCVRCCVLRGRGGGVLEFGEQAFRGRVARAAGGDDGARGTVAVGGGCGGAGGGGGGSGSAGGGGGARVLRAVDEEAVEGRCGRHDAAV